MRIITHTDFVFEENTYIVIDGNLGFVVDPGLNFSNIIKEYENIDFKFAILTHAHIDHVDGIKCFNKPIYILEEEYESLFNPDITLYSMMDLEIPYLDKKKNVIKINDGDSLSFGGYEIKVIKTPGHTKGSACYLFNHNVLFTGDTLFKGSVGRCDLPTGNEIELNKSLAYLVNKLSNKVTIYPGHGKNSTIGEEKKSNPFLLKWF